MKGTEHMNPTRRGMPPRRVHARCRKPWWAGRLLRPFPGALRDAGHGETWAEPDYFRHGEPDPEITYDDALAARPDAIVARAQRLSQPGEQCAGFPVHLPRPLDVRATTINDEMKLAATMALAALAKEDVPDSVLRAYSIDHMEFGREYIIPKPFDRRADLGGVGVHRPHG